MRKPNTSEIAAANDWLCINRHPPTTDATILASYANHVIAEAFEHAASLLPDSVHGIRGSNLTDLRYLQDHLRKRAQQLRKDTL